MIGLGIVCIKGLLQSAGSGSNRDGGELAQPAAGGGGEFVAADDHTIGDESIRGDVGDGALGGQIIKAVVGIGVLIKRSGLEGALGAQAPGENRLIGDVGEGEIGDGISGKVFCVNAIGERDGADLTPGDAISSIAGGDLSDAHMDFSVAAALGGVHPGGEQLIVFAVEGSDAGILNGKEGLEDAAGIAAALAGIREELGPGKCPVVTGIGLAVGEIDRGVFQRIRQEVEIACLRDEVGVGVGEEESGGLLLIREEEIG